MTITVMGRQHGQIIKGYELAEMIGQGGFGAVYRAQQILVDREVAVKIVLSQYANQPEFVRRFEAEARLVARLESPAIVPLYDYWRDPDGAFLVMRLLRGGSLETALTNGVAWSMADADRLLDQMTNALAVAHRNGVIHRDLKPANILLDEDSNAYLSDFGIAKNLRVTGRGDDEMGLTGSPAYMSPEQIKQQPVSPQTDIYSLGIVLYEVITGHQLFSGSTTTELLLKQLNERVVNHTIDTDLPDGVYEVIARATEKDPTNRFSDARSMYAAFHQAFIELSSTGAPAGGGDALELLEILDFGDFTFDESVLVNPYKGLRAFQEADSSDFFGRETLVKQLAGRLAENSPLARFLAVVGPSGSGKSSVVKAGLVPALKHGALPDSDRWYVLEMTPGAHPLDQLATALLSVAITPQADLATQLRQSERGFVESLDKLLPAESQLLIVIDQFEEAFTQVNDEVERTQFMDSIRVAVSDPSSRVRIIVTLRADFYDRPLLYQAFGDLIRQRTEVVLPLASAELEKAIVGPAERIGLRIEPGLIAAIISDLKEEPGTLPLLQYALTEVYERRDGRTLTLEAYKKSGGALGALARRAEELYEQADPAAQTAIRQLFLRLVTLGEGAEDTRRRARWAEIMALTSGASAIQNVLDLYVRYRLLTLDNDILTREPTIEVAHEALIREWSRLRGWLDENREELRLERRLTVASDEWRAVKRNPDFLATGARLTQFEELANSGKLTLSPTDLDYIRASVEGREAHQKIEAQKQAEEDQLKRRQQTLGRGLVVGVLVTLLSVGLAAIALIQGQIAQQERGHALDSALTATVAQGMAIAQANIANQNALTATNAQGQALLQANNAATQAAIAVNNASTATIAQGQAVAQANLADQNALTATNAQGQALLQANNAATQAMVAQNNAVTATIAQGQALVQATLANQSALTATNAQGQALVQANLANQSAMTATNAQGQALVQANIANQSALTATNAQGQALVQANNAATQAAAALNSAATATVAQGQALLQANKAATSEADAQLAKQAAIDSAIRARQAALSANAEQLLLNDANTDLSLALALRSLGTTATANPLAETILAETAYAQGTRLVLSGAQTDTIKSAVMSPDGKLAVSASSDKTLVIWDIATGQVKTRLTGHTDSVNAVVFSMDGKTIISASSDQSLIFWDVATGKLINRFTETTQNQPITSLAMSPDGTYVLAGLDDGEILQWNLATSKIDSTFRLHSKTINSIAISPDGQRALSGSDDHTAKLWLIKTGAVQGIFSNNQAAIKAVAFHPNGQELAVGFQYGAINLYNVRTTVLEATFSGHSDSVLALAFNNNGSVLASGSIDNTARLWDTMTGRALAILRGHTAPVTTLAFSSDGRTLLSASDDKTLRVWNAVNGAETMRLTAASAGYSLALNNDHTLIASGYEDGHIALIDASKKVVVRTLTGQKGLIRAMSFSPDGKMLASAADDHTILIWDVVTGTEQHRYGLNIGSVFNILFMPDNQSFITVGSEIFVWYLTGAITRKIDPSTQFGNTYLGAALSADGQILYTGSGADIVIWQMSSGTEIGRLHGHDSTINALALSGDDRQLVSGSDDTTAIIWDLTSRQMVHRLTGHTASIHSVAFSPDNLNVLTGSVDNTSRLWNAQSGSEIRRFIGHTKTVEGIVFSRLGEVTSISEDGSVRVWHIQSPTDLIAWVTANRYVRDLTCDEAFRFDPQQACGQNPTVPPVTTPTMTATNTPAK